ncbi:MAG: hypothetical protein R2828_35945 [Saprospiraceae bacterium]
MKHGKRKAPAPPGEAPEPNAAAERPALPSNQSMASTAASRPPWWSALGGWVMEWGSAKEKESPIPPGRTTMVSAERGYYLGWLLGMPPLYPRKSVPHRT